MQDTDEMARNKAVMMSRVLGFGGLVPFVLLARASLFELHTPFAPAPSLLIGYGAVILSFVGALHWGAQLSRPTPLMWRFCWSVVPALMGWVALMMPAVMASCLLITGFVICAVVDWRIIKKGEWPDYMGPLRLILSVVACLCLAVIIFVVR